MSRDGKIQIDVLVTSRREALHLAPVVHACRESNEANVRLIAIHSEGNQIRDTLESLYLQADIQWMIRGTRQNSGTYLGEISLLLSELWMPGRTDWLLSFGHGELTFAAAVAAFQNHIPIAHIEDSGSMICLGSQSRQYNQSCRSISILSDLHFTQDNEVKNALIHEGVGEKDIYSVGTTLVESTRKIEESIHADGFLRNIFESFSDEIRQRMIRGNFFFSDLRSEQCSERVSPLVEKFLEAHPELIQVIHAGEKGTFRRKSPPQLRRQGLLLTELSHLQRCAIYSNAKFILTENNESLEECSSFGTKVILFQDHTRRTDLLSSGNVSVASGRDEHLLRQMEHCMTDNSGHLTRGESPAVSMSFPSASGRIVQAITSRTNGSVQKEKTRLLSRQAG